MVKDQALISVIIPVYNVAPWLERCVRSVLAQTYKNLQIILVDDGSTDGSGQICDRLKEEDHRIVLIHKENGGLSDARNAGQAAAEGEYISFIDSDDWVDSHFIGFLYQLILKYQSDIAVCGYVRRREHCIENSPAEKSFKTKVVLGSEAMELLIRNQIPQVVWNKLYKKEVVEDCPFEKGKYHEDEFWSYRVFSKSNRCVITDYIGYCYFQRSDSIMGEAYTVKRLDAIEAKKMRQNFLMEKRPDLAGAGWINLYYACLYQGQLALKHLEEPEQEKVFGYLKETMREYPVKGMYLKGVSRQQQIWLRAAAADLKRTCRLRNLLKIGN